MWEGQTDNGKESLKEERLPIQGVDDIYKFADRLKATVSYYENVLGKKSKVLEVAA